VQVSHRGAYGTGTIAENDESTNLDAILCNLEHFLSRFVAMLETLANLDAAERIVK
jgi:hypothetical protein